MDRNGHMATRTSTPIIKRFPASHPRGSWPAEEFAAVERAAGTPVEIVMDIDTDEFVVKAVTV